LPSNKALAVVGDISQMAEADRMVQEAENRRKDESFINQVRSKITEGTSALFLLASDLVVDKVAAAVKDMKFEIISTNLSKEQEDELRADFGQEAVVADQ
jgi:uncharacterized membrane protein